MKAFEGLWTVLHTARSRFFQGEWLQLTTTIIPLNLAERSACTQARRTQRHMARIHLRLLLSLSFLRYLLSAAIRTGYPDTTISCNSIQAICYLPSVTTEIYPMALFSSSYFLISGIISCKDRITSCTHSSFPMNMLTLIDLLNHKILLLRHSITPQLRALARLVPTSPNLSIFQLSSSEITKTYLLPS